jgi:hypothetical protein
MSSRTAPLQDDGSARDASAAPHRDLLHYIRIYDTDLPAALCQRMIGSFRSLERFHTPNGRGRPGFEHSRWTEVNVTQLADEAFRTFFRGRIDAALRRYNADVRLGIDVPPSERTSDLILKRYLPGGDEAFEPHFDSIGEVANRYLALLWYLNDVAQGGETHFPQLGLRVQPRAGRLLVFPPYWMFQHEGLPPLSGDKYILSTYLLF